MDQLVCFLSGRPLFAAFRRTRAGPEAKCSANDGAWGCTKSLESTLYIPQEVRETRLIILSTCNARQTDAALPTTADMSNPQTCEASAALQPAESGSRAFSSGHSTTIEPMGTEAGNLRRRVTSPHVVFVNTDVNLQKLEEIIKASAWLRNNELEPCIGDPDCPAEADPHGIRGLSVYTAFVNRQNGDAYGCKYARCSAYSVRCMEEAVRHQRIHHFDHSPYLCLASTWNAWYISVFHIPARCLGTNRCPSYSYRRFPSQVDLNSHQQNCPW